MVIPFMSLYLTNFLEFSFSEVGWVLSFYGFGSVFGVLIGGKLSDRIGYHKVMYLSVLITGFIFFAMQFITDFYTFCFGVFILTFFADAFRPAVWVAIDDYSETENRTRSVTLIRLAINLGFSMGPALGGLLITYISYKSLFWVDGITCLIAGLILIIFLKQKSGIVKKEASSDLPKISPYRDRRYLIFWLAMFLIGFTFMQYFSTIPLYYSRELGLAEDKIGLMLAMNGLMIFLLEMPLVHSLEKGRLDSLKIVIAGVFLLMCSFLILNVGIWIGFAVTGIILMTFGEMLGFPFSNSFALDRSKKGNQGAYMALYSMAFSVAHILGPNLGMQFSDKFGFQSTWYLMAAICLLACFILIYLQRKELN